MRFYYRASCVVIVLSMMTTAYADVLLPGYRGVSHQLVFEDSEALRSHRLVAAPIRGFGGVVELEPGKPFRFSTKYGTRFYVVPREVEGLPDFHRELYGTWPSTKPPVTEINAVPMASRVESAITTLRLVSVDSAEPVIEIVEHVEHLSSLILELVPLAVVFVMGSCVCIYVYRKTRRSSATAATSLKKGSS